MKKKKPDWELDPTSEEDVPSWVTDDSLDRTTPYTEEELDQLVEGTREGVRDTPVWERLVDWVGQEEALSVLRARLIMRDENARKQTRH